MTSCRRPPQGPAPIRLEQLWPQKTGPQPVIEGKTLAAVRSQLPPIPSPSRGLYTERPELLYDVDRAADPDRLVGDLLEAVKARVRERVPTAQAVLTPRMRAGVSVDTAVIEQALRTDLPSFFVTGGRTFDVKDGWGRWHSVTVAAGRIRSRHRRIDRSADRAKFDTRIDATTTMKDTATFGESLVVGAGMMVGGRFGPGGGVAGGIALAQTAESTEEGSALFNSHNVRSGGVAHLEQAPVRFSVTAGAPGKVPPPPAYATGPARPGDVTADIMFHTLEEIDRAKPRDDARSGDFDIAALVENAHPVRILDARIGDAPAAGGWNDAAEHILAELTGTGVTNPGSIGRDQVRSLLTEANVLGSLMPALESSAHSPLILSDSRARTAGLEMTTQVTAVRAVADVAKSTFRRQPGVAHSARRQHRSAVGGGGSVVPIRWGFGGGWVQGRLSAGFQRVTTLSAREGSTSRTGTEAKDVENTLTELTVMLRVNPAVRVNAFRNPLPRPAGAQPVDLELRVLTRMPKAVADSLLRPGSETPPVVNEAEAGPETLSVVNEAVAGPETPPVVNEAEAGPETPPAAVDEPKAAPPFAAYGGHAMPSGMSRFRGLQPSTETLVRRIGGGFLPRFRLDGVAARMGLAGSAVERQRNQAELDRVLSVPSLRQNYTALLNGGLSAVLTRSGPSGDRHVVVHVTAEHPEDLASSGTEKQVAVRTLQGSGEQDAMSAGAQWRAAAAAEGAAVGRFPGAVNIGVQGGGGIEVAHRRGRDGGVETSGQNTVVHGGTTDSERFDGPLRLKVSVYSYRTGVGLDRGSRIGLGRTVHPRGTSVTAGPVPGFTRDDAVLNGQAVPRYERTETQDVRVLYSGSAVPEQAQDHPVTVDAREREDLARRTRTNVETLRDYVDRPEDGDDVTVDQWQSVESMPAGAEVLELARRAATDTQQYADRASRRQLGGLRGPRALQEGMPVWADITNRLTTDRQIAGLGAMTESHWTVGPVTTMEGGGRLELAVSSRITNPRLVPAKAEITAENASGGGTQVWGARTRDRLVQWSAQAGLLLRAPAQPTDKFGGGGTLRVSYQRLLHAKLVRGRDKVSGFIERNINNRKGHSRTYLVVADVKVTTAAEVSNPARFPKSLVPGPLQPASWEHHKTVRHSATIRNGVYLRVDEAQAVRMGLLPATDDGTTVPHARPSGAVTDARVDLPPGRSPGQGLQVFRDVPSLVEPATEVLRAAAEDPQRKPLVQPVLDALTGTGLSDPMLNRERMRQMLSRDGLRRSWGNLFDGGVSLIHADTGLATQHLYDVRLEARMVPDDPAEFRGFHADHDDIDVRTVGTRGSDKLVRTARGDQVAVGGASTAALNPHGKQAGLGFSHDYASARQTAIESADEHEQRDTDISSARGVKARLTLRPVFELKVYSRGEALPDGTVTFRAPITVDRSAGDVRTEDARSAPAPLDGSGGYRPTSGPGPEPGWTRRNGLLVPPRYAPEGLGPAKPLQDAAVTMLDGAGKRLTRAGYLPAAQVRAGLTPDLLLPNTATLLSPEMLELPAVPGTDVLMRKAQPKVGLEPVAVRLAGVDSTVYREHMRQTARVAGTGRITQQTSAHMPKVLAGRAYMGDPAQTLENSGTGPGSGETTAAGSSDDGGATSFGNLKPEGPSVLLEYVTRPALAATLTGPVSRTERSAAPESEVRVQVRTGLSEARRVLGIDDGAPAEAREAFDAVVQVEDRLQDAASRFQEASEAEAAIRYGSGGSTDPAERAAWEQALERRNQAETEWWALAQEHYRRLDDFQARFVALGASHAPALAVPSGGRPAHDDRADQAMFDLIQRGGETPDSHRAGRARPSDPDR